MKMKSNGVSDGVTLLLAVMGLCAWGSCLAAENGACGTLMVRMQSVLKPDPLTKKRQGKARDDSVNWFAGRASAQPGDLLIQIRYVDGKAQPRMSGYAPGYNLQLHWGALKEAVGGVEQPHLGLDLTIGQDDFGKGGSASIVVDLKRGSEGYRGTFTGTVLGQAVKGQAVAEFRAWPKTVAGTAPAADGDHPRLLFRKADVETLKKRAATAEGKKMIEQLRKQLTFARNGVFEWHAEKRNPPGAPAYCEGQWATGAAFMWFVTREKEFLELSVVATERAMDAKGGEWGGWARSLRRAGVAFAYDLCHGDWDQAFRDKVVSWLAAQLAGKNAITRYAPDDNFANQFVFTGALVALAISGDPGAGTRSEEVLAEFEHFLPWFEMTSVGSFGWHNESIQKTDMLHIMLPCLHAWYTARGQDPIGGTRMAAVVPQLLATDLKLENYDWGRNSLVTTFFPCLTPAEWRPVLRKWLEYPGSTGDHAVIPDAFHANHPWHVAFLFQSFPWDLPAQPLSALKFPLTWRDTRFGAVMTRSGWEKGDFMVVVEAQEDAPRFAMTAGNVGIVWGDHWKLGEYLIGGGTGGFRRMYTWNRPAIPRVENAVPGAGGRIVHYEAGGNGALSVTMELDHFVDGYSIGANLPEPFIKARNIPENEAYFSESKSVKTHFFLTGERLDVKMRRAVTVDFSGKSGAPCTVVIADRFTGLPDRPKFVDFPLFDWALAKVGENGFSVSKERNEQLVHGRVVWPLQPKVTVVGGSPGNARVEGSDEYITVIHAMKGDAPPSSAKKQGNTFVVTAGAQTYVLNGDRFEIAK